MSFSYIRSFLTSHIKVCWIKKFLKLFFIAILFDIKMNNEDLFIHESTTEENFVKKKTFLIITSSCEIIKVFVCSNMTFSSSYYRLKKAHIIVYIPLVSENWKGDWKIYPNNVFIKIAFMHKCLLSLWFNCFPSIESLFNSLTYLIV